MGWRSVVISRPAYLSLKQRQLFIEQKAGAAHVPLEDISALVLDNPQITITQPLLCTLAEYRIVVLTVDQQHLPNGIFLPYMGYHRQLKRLKSQLNLSKPRIKQWHREIVRQKIRNQSKTLSAIDNVTAAEQLARLSDKVRSGDPDNREAQAAQLYFRHLRGSAFKRREASFFNAALNYGYAVTRAAIARSLTVAGLHPSIGLFHHNEQNAFNLADDLIEPYRPILDLYIALKYPEELDRQLLPEDKGYLVSFLHNDIGNNHNEDCYTALAHIEQMVSHFASACEKRHHYLLWLAEHPPLSD